MGKEEVNLSLFTESMIHQKTLRSDNTFHKVAGYKINIWKWVAFPYINNEHAEKEIRKAFSLTIA
jgi:hypothetical protein